MILPRGLREAWRASFTAFSLASAPAEREEHAAACETGFLQQHLREPRARLRAPGVGHEAELLGLPPDRGDDARMLMAEAIALREAAHVENAAAIFCMKPRAGAAHDSRRRPVRLPAPAVQNGFALGGHFISSCRPGQLIEVEIPADSN